MIRSFLGEGQWVMGLYSCGICPIPEEIFNQRHRRKRSISGRGDGPEVRENTTYIRE